MESFRQGRSTLDVIEECMKENKLRRWKRDVYYESWGSICKWLESRIGRLRGASLPNTCSFVWDIRSDGSRRPVFLLSESLIKKYKLKFPILQPHQMKTLTAAEDISFSAVALKFSSTLTKEMVMATYLHIQHKFEQLLDQLIDFELVFPFGTLHHSKRKLKFDFNANRLIQVNYALNERFILILQILPQSLRPFESNNRTGRSDESLQTDDSSVEEIAIKEDMHGNGYPNSNIEKQPKTVELPAYRNQIDENMAASRKAAYDEALLRWLKSVEEDISTEQKFKLERSFCDDLNDHQVRRINRSKEQMNELKMCLNEQVAELQRKKAIEASSRRAFEPSFFLEENPHDKERAIANRNSRAQIQSALAADVSERKNRSVAEKKSKQEEERKFAKEDLEQYRMDCEAKRTEKLRNLTALLALKAHEDQLSQVKRASRGHHSSTVLPSLVQSQFQRDLVSPIKIPTPSRRFENLGVGYDSRRGSRPS